MMLAKCANGHFYDADTYNSCPHCKSEISDDLEFESIDVDYNEDNVLENNYNQITIFHRCFCTNSIPINIIYSFYCSF